MTKVVPRGTRGWPAEFDAMVAEQMGEPDYSATYQQERTRERAAGYAHLDRLAVDGGPITEARPRRRTLQKALDGLIVTLGVILISGVLVLGMYEVLR